jgi:hypothetical protein
MQARFFALLRRLELHGLVHSHPLKCSHAREEALAEMVARCWSQHRTTMDRQEGLLAGFGD